MNECTVHHNHNSISVVVVNVAGSFEAQKFPHARVDLMYTARLVRVAKKHAHAHSAQKKGDKLTEATEEAHVR